MLIGWIAFFAMGIVLGLIGGGGSILTVPILVYLFGQDPHTATGGSLFIVGAVAVVGALMAFLKKEIKFTESLPFALPSIAGVILARTYLLPLLPDPVIQSELVVISKDGLLMVLFAFLMLMASYKMIRTTAVVTKRQTAPWLQVALQGLFIGAITGFIGAGGGFLIVPALVFLLGYSLKQAIGTSLLVIALNSFVGCFADVLQGEPKPWPLLFTAVGVAIVGLFVGRRLTPYFSEKTLKIIFGWFILVLGSTILLEQALK
jgi:uncharacterized membrane protein YfcA